MLLAPLMLLAGAVYAAPYIEIEPRTNIEATNAFDCDGTPFTAIYINQVIQHAATQKDVQTAMKQAAIDENYAYHAFKELPDCIIKANNPPYGKAKLEGFDFCHPKEFKNLPDKETKGQLQFTNCPSGPWIEFPLMADGKTLFTVDITKKQFMPGTTNPARVIYETSGSTTKFCGAITHSSKVEKGQFIACAATS